jgi:GNAT superfamily N-acetyltransferase
MKLEITAEPTQADEEFIMAGTRSYNRAFAEPDGKNLCVFARDAEGNIIGGLTARTYWQYLDIKFLWVHERHRKEGLGSRIMLAVEAEARSRGCTGAFLDTFCFQARIFYERLGYAEFGRLSGFSGKHERHFMQKSLVAADALPSCGLAFGQPLMSDV